jgi:hypothetical protein
VSIKDINLVLGEMDAIADGVQSLFYDSMREAGEIVAKELAAKAPEGSTGRLRDSFGVWQAKRESRRYRSVIFKIGLKSNYFFSTLAKGRKAHKRGGYAVRASQASHPEWQLPGESESARNSFLRLTKTIFNGKVATLDRVNRRRR